MQKYIRNKVLKAESSLISPADIRLLVTVAKANFIFRPSAVEGKKIVVFDPVVSAEVLFFSVMMYK